MNISYMNHSLLFVLAAPQVDTKAIGCHAENPDSNFNINKF